MNILLVVPRYNLDSKPNYDYVLPIGMAYIYSALVNEGHSVDCLNLNHTYGSVQMNINKKLDSKKFDLVGTGNNALGYAVTEEIIRVAKLHHSKPKTILGGPIITSEPDLIFDSLSPTFAVLGEGEETVVKLLRALEKKENLKKINGLMYHDSNGKIVRTSPSEPIRDLDSIAFPNYDAFGISEQLNNISTNFIFYTNLFDNTRMYPLLASRSCPFQCTFCYHDSRYRKRSMDNIMEELSYAIKKYRINLIAIHDECFSIDKARLKEFCQRLNILRKEIGWDLKWTCQLRVETLDKETLEMMKEAGCAVIGYGLESYSKKVLESMGKHITPEQIFKAVNMAFEVKMALQSFFIFGDPAETKETAKETLDYWKKYCRGQVGLGFIEPYPGSVIYNYSVEKGLIKNKLEYIKNEMGPHNAINMTRDMSTSDFQKLREEILDLFGKYTKFTKPLKVKKMDNGKYAFTVKCPFCKEVMTYKNCKIGNRFTYGFNLICRKCLLRFFVVSEIQRIGYAYYSKVRVLRDFQKKITRAIKRKNL